LVLVCENGFEKAYSSMGYELPPVGFNAIEHATNKVLRANQFEELVLAQFMATYEDFWGVQSNGGSRYTTEQMQQILNAMPMLTAIDILTDAGAFRSYLIRAYPDKLPEKYRVAAWDYTDGESGIVLTQLRPEWQPPVVEVPADEPAVPESVDE